MFCPGRNKTARQKNIQITFLHPHKRARQQTAKCLIKNMKPLQNVTCHFFLSPIDDKKVKTGVYEIIFQKYNAKYWLDIESYCQF